MKNAFAIAGLILLASGTAAFAASPETVVHAVASCCNALAAFCQGGTAPCCT